MSLLDALTGGGASSNAVTRIIPWREIAAEQLEVQKAGEGTRQKSTPV
jgi:hypothetical protein